MNRRPLLIIGGVVLLAVVALLFVSRVGVPTEAAPTPTPEPTQTPATTTPEPSTPSPASASLTLQAAPDNTFITLTWSSVEGAAGYQIFRDAADRPLNAELITDTRYQDIGLTNGRTYTYRVVAVSADGVSLAESDTVEAAPTSRP
ncbi:MAG: fibronectin type III domain-containing protein [Anaerolineae bacterium]